MYIYLFMVVFPISDFTTLSFFMYFVCWYPPVIMIVYLFPFFPLEALKIILLSPLSRERPTGGPLFDMSQKTENAN